MTRTRIAAVVVILAMTVLGFGAGRAEADGARVIIEPPVFYPHAEFPFENGYYRTNEGHYYHYDRDRAGWHYGRNHREGVRYERGHRR
jgi:hypothetical protein